MIVDRFIAHLMKNWRMRSFFFPIFRVNTQRLTSFFSSSCELISMQRAKGVIARAPHAFLFRATRKPKQSNLKTRPGSSGSKPCTCIIAQLTSERTRSQEAGCRNCQPRNLHVWLLQMRTVRWLGVDDVTQRQSRQRKSTCIFEAQLFSNSRSTRQRH